MTIAQKGLVPFLCSSPRSTMPRHSHSSQTGAKMLTIRKLVKMFPLVRLSMASFRNCGISGSRVTIPSDQNPRAMVPTVTSSMLSGAPRGAK